MYNALSSTNEASVWTGTGKVDKVKAVAGLAMAGLAAATAGLVVLVAAG